MNKTALVAGLTVICLSNSPILCGSNQKKETKEVNQEAVAQLDAYTKYAGISALAAIGTGALLKNDMLMGLGVGTAGGVSAAVFQKNYHWILVWLAESFGRDALVHSLCATDPNTVNLTQQDLSQAAQRARSVLSFIRPDLSEIERERFVAQAVADSHPILQKNKALRTISYSAQGASWISYLIYRYLENKTEQPA